MIVQRKNRYLSPTTWAANKRTLPSYLRSRAAVRSSERERHACQVSACDSLTRLRKRCASCRCAWSMADPLSAIETADWICPASSVIKRPNLDKNNPQLQFLVQLSPISHFSPCAPPCATELERLSLARRIRRNQESLCTSDFDVGKPPHSVNNICVMQSPTEDAESL